MKEKEVVSVKIYTGDNELKLVQSVASASTLISSVTGEIKEFIASRFPREFFKSIYIDTAETIQAENRNRKHNQNLNKLPYPNLAISPQISLDDPIGGMEKSMHLSSPNLYLRRDMKRNYKKLVLDPKNKFSIYFTSDYITTNFDFKITTNKFIQNMDLAYYIKSRFQIGMFQFLNDKYLNTEIPKTYIKLIAEMLGLDVNNSTDMDELRMYLISTGTQEQMILKKINAMTGKDCFFVNEKNNFLTLITDLDAPSAIIRESMSEGEYRIIFRAQVSAWLPNAFIMSIDPDKFESLSTEVKEEAFDDSILQQDEGFYSVSIPNITLNRKEIIEFENSTGEQVIGQEVFHNVFTYNINYPITSINLGEYLRDDLKKVHAYMVAKNFDLKDLMNIRLYNRVGAMGPKQVVIDYENLRVTILNSNDQDFSLAVYVDRAMFESILKAIEMDRFFFSDNSLATFRIKHLVEDDFTGEEDVVEFKVPVYSFADEREMSGTASEVNGEYRNNTFRVQTAYGVGFIGLVDENHANASDYKICIGFENDDETKPIIKSLEKLED